MMEEVELDVLRVQRQVLSEGLAILRKRRIKRTYQGLEIKVAIGLVHRMHRAVDANTTLWGEWGTSGKSR